VKRFEDVARELVTEWLQMVQRVTGDLTEGDIDHAVDDTFPASDPIAVGAYRERVDALTSLDVVVTPGSITFKVPVGVLETASKHAADELLAKRSIECATLAGKTLTLRVEVLRSHSEALPVETQSAMATLVDSAARG
jgi:hypothetical protein